MSRKQGPDILASAVAGYRGEPFAGLYTSAMHAAHCIGDHMRATGRTEPRSASPSRGDTFRCNDMLFRLNWASVKHPTISRES